MSFGVSNVSGANGALAGSGLSRNGAVAAQTFLNPLLGQEEAPRSGGEAFLADVKESKDSEQKRALIDGFAEGFAAASEAGASDKAAGTGASSAADGAGAADAGGEDEAAAPAGDAKASESAETGTWSHEVKDGEATIQLGDKYTVKANEKDATWTVTNNETGKTTKVWGDPHVDTDNDGKNDFDFKKDMTFQLDDGTKITVGTVPSGENDTTCSSSLTITNGDKAVQVTGLGDSHDSENNLEVTQSDAGTTLDDLEHDGATAIYENGGAWQTKDGKAVDQSIIDAAEAAAA